MTEPMKVRWGWLRFIYIYTLVGAGGAGLGVLVAPEAMKSALRLPTQDPVVYGVFGSVYLAFALLSILGLRSPLRFSPVLLLQLCYKVIWLIGVILPMWIERGLPTHALILAVIFVSYVIGDLIAIPFGYVFRSSSDS